MSEAAVCGAAPVSQATVNEAAVSGAAVSRTAASHPQTSQVDIRVLLFAGGAWAGALAGLLLDGPLRTVGVLTALLAAAGCWVAGCRGALDGWSRLAAAVLLVATGLATVAGLHTAGLRDSAVAALAEERAVARVELEVRSDPHRLDGAYGPVVLLRATTRMVAARGQRWGSRVPVLVLADEDWNHVRLGSVVAAAGRLAPPRDGDVAAVLHATSRPSQLSPPGPAYAAADRVRASVRSAAGAGPGTSPTLVPALVTGDDAALPDDVVADFQEAGLTHLTAVSGTNLTLVLGFLLVVGGRIGVRGRARLVLGLLGVVGFVLLARPEPSVVRAAAMGTVGLLGMGAGRRGSGVRALSVAVVVLLLVEPALAVSAGFALSAVATAGILLVAPAVRDALAASMPRWLAEAVAVPMAAQLACTPLVAALSGQVSLVAVVANLVVAPLVGPATVLGLLGGLVALVVAPAGTAVGWLACWCCELVIVVARAAAGLPGAALSWPTGPVGIAALTVACIGLLLGAAPLVRRRGAVLTCSVSLVVVLLRPVPTPATLAGLFAGGGWPPRGWVVVMCDVGQGDALVLRTAPEEAVVVDAGPDPETVDGCLRRLGIARVPAVVLTHFHADHVDGLPGVLRGREVAEIEVSPLREPAYGAAQVERQAAEANVPVRIPAYGERTTVGAVTWQEVGPSRVYAGSPNDGSIVLLVRSRGTRLLLPGDIEPPAQSALLRAGLPPVDVLKVPHHGSRYQDLRLLSGLGARVALVSVGRDNDYGHPAESTLDALASSGAVVARSDRDGDVAVVLRAGDLTVVRRG